MGILDVIRWRLCKQDESGRMIFLGDVVYCGPHTILDILTMFDENTGCLWRVGKTSSNQVTERAVEYQCVHRPPTHGSSGESVLKVGGTYMKYGNARDHFIFLENKTNNVGIFYDKLHEVNVQIQNPMQSTYRVGARDLSFGCEAKLTFRKVFSGSIVVQVEWCHNHNMDAFATKSRRDPSKCVKDWFIAECTKGVPAMKALRSYVEQIFLVPGVKDQGIAEMLADRFLFHIYYIYFLVINDQKICAISKRCFELVSRS